MHDDDRLRSGRDRFLDSLRVDVERIPADVDKNRDRAAQHERVGGRRERERRHDDLVARPYLGENGGHFEGTGARMRKARVASDALREPRLATLRVGSITRQVPRFQRIGDIIEFGANEWRAIVGDKHMVSSRLLAPG